MKQGQQGSGLSKEKSAEKENTEQCSSQVTEATLAGKRPAQSQKEGPPSKKATTETVKVSVPKYWL